MEKITYQHRMNRNAYRAAQRLRKAEKRLARSRAWFAEQGMSDEPRWKVWEADIAELRVRADHWATRAKEARP